MEAAACRHLPSYEDWHNRTRIMDIPGGRPPHCRGIGADEAAPGPEPYADLAFLDAVDPLCRTFGARSCNHL